MKKVESRPPPAQPSLPGFSRRRFFGTAAGAMGVAGAGSLLTPGLLAQGAESRSGNDAVCELGSRRELFVDHYLIERMQGAQLKLHRPEKAGLALSFDQPWEGPYCAYCTVIAAVNAPYQGGELLTKPFTFTGRNLAINFTTSAAGSIRVEMQGADGKPIPGYTFDDARELIGNEIERVVSWKGGDDVSKLVGQTVRLRFVMKDADLYALKFS